MSNFEKEVREELKAIQLSITTLRNDVDKLNILNADKLNPQVKIPKLNELEKQMYNMQVDIDRLKLKNNLDKLNEPLHIPELTDVERTILQNLPTGYEYIARDGNDDCLYVFKKEPEKNQDWWGSYADREINPFLSLGSFSHLFQFVEWSDPKPYKISDLLGE